MLIRDLSSLKWLLENLGFLINWKKSDGVPTQVIQFLGFLIDSVEMVILLPEEKILKISAGPDLTITSDASKKGWGATLGAKRVQGLRTSEVAGLYINVLELKGAVFAQRTFAQNMRKVHVHLKMDNKIAVAYIQKMGGARSARMLSVTQEIWQFALDREIMLSAEYLPGSLNTEADWQSRNFQDSSDWQLKKSVFQQLNNRWGPLHLDLFASRHNTQLKNYVSWHPDPFAQTVDAFQRHWKEKGLYLFPPFATVFDEVPTGEGISGAGSTTMADPTMVPPSLFSMLSDNPILLPPYKNLYHLPHTGCIHLHSKAGFA